MGNYTLRQLLRSEGSVRQSVLGMIVGTIVNLFLDPLFIFAFGLEIKGAAIATILGNTSDTQPIMGFNYSARNYRRWLYL